MTVYTYITLLPSFLVNSIIHDDSSYVYYAFTFSLYIYSLMMVQEHQNK